MQKMLLDTFIDFGVMTSGSSVRPQRMYEAFKELGFQVDLLEGLQNRKRERWKRALNKIGEVRKDLPDFCYVEPPSGPFFNLCDHLLLIYLKIKGVPIGLFYRDAYWKYADWWQIKGFKRFFLSLMQRFDLFIFKRTCRVVFFPTQSMADLFRLPRKSVLPPAGMDFVPPPHPVCRRVLYIGGVSYVYGTDVMLRAFEILNEERHKNISLTVVCREDEMKNFFDGYENRPWLEIAHASGDEQLRPYYGAADLAVYPNRKDQYMDFCMPVKLFEYLSRGLPVIATNCRETASFVERHGFGVVTSGTPEDMAEKVSALFDDPQRLAALHKNAVAALRDGNLWKHRALQAATEILGSGPCTLKRFPGRPVKAGR